MNNNRGGGRGQAPPPWAQLQSNSNHNNYNNYNNGYNDRNKFERYNSHSDLFASIQNQATQNAQQQIEAIRNGNLGYTQHGWAIQTRSMCNNKGSGDWTW